MGLAGKALPATGATSQPQMLGLSEAPVCGPEKGGGQPAPRQDCLGWGLAGKGPGFLSVWPQETAVNKMGDSYLVQSSGSLVASGTDHRRGLKATRPRVHRRSKKEPGCTLNLSSLVKLIRKIEVPGTGHCAKDEFPAGQGLSGALVTP